MTLDANHTEKNELHLRNKHRSRYNFQQLCYTCKELLPHVFTNKFGEKTIDFANPESVIVLNKALLKQFYDIHSWDIPAGYLCPPSPGRADYIPYVADLLASFNNNKIPRGKSIKILDVGVGANCIYPIIGLKEYNWDFVGSDIDFEATISAKKIIDADKKLKGRIDIRLQKDKKRFFENILVKDELIDACICNPPFHASSKEAKDAAKKKWEKLKKSERPENLLNFGGQNNELWVKGGEETFVREMAKESQLFGKNCFWFTTLVAKKANLASIYRMLHSLSPVEVKTITMAQGQKESRIVAWTFLSETEQQDWIQKRWKATK